jgi:hypothetical protein
VREKLPKKNAKHYFPRKPVDVQFPVHQYSTTSLLSEMFHTLGNGVNLRTRTPDVENRLGVSATYDPSPTRGRHAPQRDATRCNADQGLVGGRLLVGPGNGARGDPGVPSVTEPEQADRSRAHRLAQPANSYQRQKCSPSRETLPRMYLRRQALP